ncbi:uncharacterized protein LOC127794104 isoform X2 [Diospyros lotus]|nr:uncharacterized protein LOC127794104 isoform X2 [Diospyros lotus]
MPKNEMRSKSTRRPLRDVSNGVRPSKSVKNKAPSDNANDSALFDRLLLIHSNLSSLVHQIDGFVVEALKVKVTNRKARHEIESFTQVLSEVESSLKPWAPRLQKALSSHSIGPTNQLGHSLLSSTAAPTNENDIVWSPEQTKLDSLVSPSPLVSWRVDCTDEGVRQLFLLTPLPRSKAFSSKIHGSSKPVIENMTSNVTVEPPPLNANSGDANDGPVEGQGVKQTPSKVSDAIVTKGESSPAHGLKSPPKFLRNDCSVLVMTPCLKMSPPRSCVLLEPISGQVHKHNHKVWKSTPFPVGIQDLTESQTSESSGSEITENLALKYPELFGIQHHKLQIGRKAIEASPDWLMSPPKTCVLLEPPDEKSLTNGTSNCQLSATTCVQNQQISFAKQNDVQSHHYLTRRSYNEGPVGSLALIESTPTWKGPKSTIQTKKHPGENTLKKELWTRFDAASTNGIRFNVSVLQETTRKGFLDRLEEVSCDEKSPCENFEMINDFCIKF